MASHPMLKDVRLVRVFAAKLVLEVFGGGGAVWGFSEVLTLRNNTTEDEWRYRAELITVFFFVRFILQVADHITEPLPPGRDDEKHFINLLEMFMAKLVLEVFGSVGAIWGFTEALTLRREDTQEFWRCTSLLVGIVFLIRYLMQLVDYIKEMNSRQPSTATIRPMTRFYQIFSARLVLQVFGGVGAIWGFSEIVLLRQTSTQGLWRCIALVFGFLFYVRFCLQMKDYIIDLHYPSKILTLSCGQWFHLVCIFSMKMILEVGGAPGAIWYFSESMTLRGSNLHLLLRCLSLSMGTLLLVRFKNQLIDYLLDVMEEEEALIKPSETLALRAVSEEETNIANERDTERQADVATESTSLMP